MDRAGALQHGAHSSGLGSVLQTELLPRCGEIAPVGQVVHENGKVLLQAVLEVRDSGTTGSSPEQGQLWALFLSSIAAEPRAESPAAWVGAGRRSAGSVCSVAGHRWPGLPQSHGSLRRNPLCLEQALLQLPEPLDQGGHAAGWLPLSPRQPRAEGDLQPADPQVRTPLPVLVVPPMPWE